MWADRHGVLSRRYIHAVLIFGSRSHRKDTIVERVTLFSDLRNTRAMLLRTCATLNPAGATYVAPVTVVNTATPSRPTLGILTTSSMNCATRRSPGTTATDKPPSQLQLAS